MITPLVFILSNDCHQDLTALVDLEIKLSERVLKPMLRVRRPQIQGERYNQGCIPSQLLPFISSSRLSQPEW